jgi:hypothetical protein
MNPIKLIGRRLLAGAALVAVLPLAAACGSSTPTAAPTVAASSSSSSDAPSTTASATAAGADYCEALRSGQAELEKITGSINDPAAAKQGLAVLEQIAAAAPAEVKDQWADFVEFIEVVVAGDTAALPTVMDKMTTSMTTIEQHAKSECGIDMS